MELGEALGAVAALQQEGLPLGDLGQQPLEATRFAGEYQRRKVAELALHLGELVLVGIVRHLDDRSAAPAVGTPRVGH